MDIVIVAQYLRDITNFEENNSRFVYLAKLLKEHSEAEVEIVTSDFNHATKKHFDTVGKLSGIHITPLHESGYAKNVTLKRFKSHKELAQNLERYFEERNKPDIIYAAVPSLDVAEVCARYCKKNNVRFIVDIQDLWPEAFKMVVKIPVISDVAFYPMKKQADRIYSAADEVVAVSETYANRAMLVNKKCKHPQIVYLGTDKKTFDDYTACNVDKFEGITVGYIGSLAASYDIDSVIEAIAKLRKDIPVRFLVMGDGGYKEKFEAHAKEAGIDAQFTGRLSYPQMVEKLSSCDIAVNPIKKGSAGSIINRVGDYAMAGLPVVNTQESTEYRKLLLEYNAGINCECENVDELANAIKKLAIDTDFREKMAKNSRNLGSEKFDRGNSYYNLIEKLLKKNAGGGNDSLLWNTGTQL